MKKYMGFLKNNIIAPNEWFDSGFSEDSIACKDCLGTGFITNEKKKGCKFCNETGKRPMTNKWRLVKNFIESKFRTLLLSP